MARKSKSEIPRRRSAAGALAHQMISGIKLPDSQIAREATELVRQHEPEILFNHSVRVYVFGAMRPGIADPWRGVYQRHRHGLLGAGDRRGHGAAVVAESASSPSPSPSQVKPSVSR